jgi:AcrR family transcriptional regulator
MDKETYQEKKEQKLPTREKIIKVAIKLFSSRGVNYTKLVDIAKEAQISHSLVLYHFPVFDDICYAVLEAFTADYQKILKKLSSEAQATENFLENFVRAHFSLAQKRPRQFSIWLHFYYKAALNKKYRALLESVRTFELSCLRLILNFHSAKHGIAKSSHQIESDATFILSIISGNIILALTRGPEGAQEYAEITNQMIQQYLEGFATKH